METLPYPVCVAFNHCEVQLLPLPWNRHSVTSFDDLSLLGDVDRCTCLTFNRYRNAEVPGEAGWAAAATLHVSGVFPGVCLPQDARQVILEFKPYVRYAWIAHIVWLSPLVTLTARAMRRLSMPKHIGVSKG